MKTENKILIGWAEEDITPENKKVELAGQYYQRIATGIHSRLKTVALVLENADAQALMISVDLVSFNEDFQNTLRTMISAEIPELSCESIFINATHTHNAPYTRPTALFRDWLPIAEDVLQPAEYIEFLQNQIVKAAVNAWNSRKAGAIAAAFARASIGHCRRAVYKNGTAEMYGDTSREDFIGMEAGEDSGVEIIFSFDENGKTNGAIINVACPSQCMEATYEISSDFMGATRELLKKEFGENFNTLCQISSSGCQSPRDLLRRDHSLDFWKAEGVKIIAERLSKAVISAYSDAEKQKDFSPQFRHTCTRVKLPIRRASYLEYCKAKEDLCRLLKIQEEKPAYDDFCRELLENEKIPGRLGPFDSKLHHFVLIKNAQAVLKRYEEQKENADFSFDMQCLRIGDSAMVNCPFELYLYFGQIIKARSKAKQTFVVQLSGGSASYLPSPDAERFGGYGGLINNGKVGSDGGYLLADSAIEKINELWS